MSVLAQVELKRRMYALETPRNERLTITPLLDSGQVGTASVDVRLGNEFILTRLTNLSTLDPADKDLIEQRIGEYQERVRVGFGLPFALHPNHLVLGSTLEYVSVPLDVTAQVIGRSSWGRLGLIIATATAVSPGFKGAITLELINGGQAPLILYPGVVIAQLVFEETTNEATYKGRYSYPTGPQFSRIHEDADVPFWGNPENFR